MRHYFTALLLFVALPSLAAPGDGNWNIRIASWNLLNLGLTKAGLPPPTPLNAALIARYAQIIQLYDIVFVQELLNDGTPLTTAIAAQLSTYNCQTISQPSGRAGRQERYGVCFATARLALVNVHDLMGTPAVPVVTPPPTQPAQNVWMRPPLRVTFTYTPLDGTPYTFDVYVSHTKPAFGATGPPPGTPANAANNRSVFYELSALENNLAAGGNVIVLGDLNVDCASYPAADHGRNFQAGWHWYPGGYGNAPTDPLLSKTNTAPLSHCIYDRLILNDNINQKYRGHGIHTAGIDTRLDGKRVSDHFLVWVEIGNRQVQPPALAVAIATPVANHKRRRLDAAADGGPQARVNAVRMKTEGTSAARLAIVTYDAKRHFDGNATYPLVDVRGASTPVTVTDAGSFSEDVVWAAPVVGQYSLVVDRNGDGLYRKTDGDVANEDDEIDFIVTSATAVHNDLMTLGDNGQSRERFNEDAALNIYALGRSLTPNTDVDLYVVAAKLLTNFAGWAAARAAGTLLLEPVSVPVRFQKLAPALRVRRALVLEDKLQTVRTDSDGTFFTAAWEKPAVLFNGEPFPPAPPGTIDYKPEYAVDDDGCDDPAGCDACRFAAASSDANFRAVCNVGPQFTDTYGTKFNVIVDANRNGRFDAPDLVDTHDIGDIETYLGTHDVLDASADGNAAVGEYKELLNEKLNLTVPLPAGNVYDAATRDASARYLCSPDVPKGDLPFLRADKEVGFLLLNEHDYVQSKQFASGVTVYDDATVRNGTVAAGANVCLVAANLTLDGFSAPPGTNTIMPVQSGTIGGTVEASAFCVSSAGTLAFAAGLALIPAPDPLTKGGAIVFGGYGLLQAGLCAAGF